VVYRKNPLVRGHVKGPGQEAELHRLEKVMGGSLREHAPEDHTGLPKLGVALKKRHDGRKSK